MSRKRSRSIKLVLLGTASLIVGGCGGCDKPNEPAGGVNLPNIDQALAKQAVAAGTSVVVSDAFLQGVSLIASGPIHSGAAPLDLVRIGMAVDQADETVAVTSHESGLPVSSNPNQPVRHVYHYHSSPGIGWFLWGHMLGSSMNRTGQTYVPPRNYGTTPRSFTTAGGAGRSGGSPSTSGGVSRGGFGSSGSAHASGGSS